MSRLKLFIPLIIFAVLAVFFWRGLSLDPTEMPSALIGKPVPQFRLPTLENPDQMMTQVDLQGEVALLNVWATWCIACRVEHPYLVQLAEQGVRVIGINYKDDVIEAQKWLKNLHNPYVYSLIDADGRLGIDLGVFGAPETYVVDRQGIIRHKHVGVVDHKVWTEQLKPLVDQLQ